MNVRSSRQRSATPEATKAWRQVITLLGERRWLATTLVAVSVPAAVLESSVLVLVAVTAGALVTKESRVSLTVGPFRLGGTVDRLLVIGVVLALARIALQGLLAYLPARLLAGTQARLRRMLFGAFLRAPWPLKSGEQEGQLQELLTSQILQATSIIDIALGAVVTGTTLLVLVIAALLVGLLPAVIVLAVGFGLFGLLRPLGGVGSRRARSLSAIQMDYANAVGEATRLAEEMQVYGAGNAVELRFVSLVEAIRRRYQMTSFLGRLVPGIYYGMVLLLLVGGLAIVAARGGGRLVSLGASILLLVRAANYGQQAQGAYQAWRQTAPFLERLGQTGDRYRVGALARGSHEIAKVPSVSFEHVSYSYVAGKPVLKDLSFKVDAGEAVGVVGPTGAGKSTLVQILLGLREPTSGEYLIDGLPPQMVSEAGLARAVAYVSQEPRLLHATVAENIAFYRNLDPGYIEAAARLAHIHEDISSWPDGYETVIGQRADAISGGQRQRICLARALAGQPVVLILDEPTSALDLQSESLIRQSLADLKGCLTLFVVAHRLSTLTFCDRVLVIVDGAIEAFAPARDLEQFDGFYRRVSGLNALSISKSH